MVAVELHSTSPIVPRSEFLLPSLARPSSTTLLKVLISFPPLSGEFGLVSRGYVMPESNLASPVDFGAVYIFERLSSDARLMFRLFKRQNARQGQGVRAPVQVCMPIKCSVSQLMFVPHRSKNDLAKQLTELKTELLSLRVQKIAGGSAAKVTKMYELSVCFLFSMV